jgi:malic enzyme
VGLGAVLCGSSLVSEDMLHAAAVALSKSLVPAERARGQCFPDVDRIREVSAQVAEAVIEKAMEQGYAKFPPVLEDGETTMEFVRRNMWAPHYDDYVFSADTSVYDAVNNYSKYDPAHSSSAGVDNLRAVLRSL